MDKLLSYVDRICHSETTSQLWDTHCQAMLDFGFDRLIYGFSRFITENSLGPREDSMILYSHPADYMHALYGADELYRHSPMLNWATANIGACSWSWIDQNHDKICPKGRSVLAINRKMGVLAGYTISFPPTPTKARGLIALTACDGMAQSEVDRIWREHGCGIEAMNHVMHLKLMTLPQQTARIRLSARQREVLEWVGSGKTNQDIATIMGVSLATVEKHLRIARTKLGVDTTAHAILKVSYFNQIRSPAG